VQEGWGTDGVRTVALGGFEPSVPALKTGQIDGIMAATEAGYLLEERGEGHILVGMEKYAPKFHTHVVFARKDLVASNPDVVARFLKGFFASIAYMKTHKDETSKVARAVLKESPQVASKTYDYEISMLEDDGHFDPAAVEVIKASLVGMKMLDTKPSDDQLFTNKFTPVSRNDRPDADRWVRQKRGPLARSLPARSRVISNPDAPKIYFIFLSVPPLPTRRRQHRQRGMPHLWSATKN
jgi:NitT/TauT family transport system substrate-binding protein